MAQLAAHAARSATGERALLAERGAALADAVDRAGVQPRQRGTVGPEAVAWTVRARAEHLRLRWLTGVNPPAQDELVEAWQDSVDAFTRYPHVFELARSQTRLAAGTAGVATVSAPTTDALTPREQEVLALVAEGRSNKEIAARLYISAKTVSVHVSNILAKLDAAGRTEAVAVARRRGLLMD